VGIDEARHDDHTGGVDHLCGRGHAGCDGDDLTVTDVDVDVATRQLAGVFIHGEDVAAFD